jgi:pimeloyl-ACP methyl ester carboxylesterase
MNQLDQFSKQIPDSIASEARMVRANGIEIYYEAFGWPSDPAVLLVMGNSAPGLVWPDAFCRQLADRGFCVVRFDQRDTGLSSYVDYDANPYTLDDLAEDVIQLLNALNLGAAHIVGLSQGGVLAWRMALRAPARVRSVTAMMSSPDLKPKNDAFCGMPLRHGELPRPAADYVAAVIALNAVKPANDEEAAIQFVDNFRLAKGPASPFDESAWLEIGRAVAGRWRLRKDGLTPTMANNSNHSRAQMATPPLAEADLRRLSVPALILHGTDDPIFPAEHARWAAEKIPGSRLVMIDGMGHAFDPAFFTYVADTLIGFFRRTG